MRTFEHHFEQQWREMAGRTYSTKQSAERLGVNEMTVRRWAKSGRLPAERLGKSWEIDADHVDRMVAATASRSLKLEFRRAARKVLNGRRRGEWLPDGLQYLDVKRDFTQLLGAVQRRWDAGDTEGQRIEHIAVAKAQASFRPGAFLRLTDEVLYAALVMACAERVEAALDDVVYSYRVAHPNDPDLLKHQGQAWGRFQEAQRQPSTSAWKYALVTDVAGFYEYIDDRNLAEVLSDLGVAGQVVGSLMGLMKGWQKKSGLRGLPQGPDASAVLANAYLLPVDEIMLAESAKRGWGYLRWSDDIRVLTPSEDEARTAAYVLSTAMRRRGLYLSPAKTTVKTVRDLGDEATDDDLDHVAYLFDSKMFDKMKVEVGPVARRATRNYRSLPLEHVTELRFCLYRMGRARDERLLRLLLQELPSAGFLESHVYLYLREFTNAPGVVDRLTVVLRDLDPQRDALLAGQLTRVLTEARALPVDTMNVVRELAWRSNAPDALRAVAIRALGLHATPLDDADLRTNLWRESDHRVVRSLLAAIKDANPSRSNATLGDFKRSNPEYATVVDYLKAFGAPNPRR